MAVVADPSQAAALRVRLEVALREASASALSQGSVRASTGIDAQSIAGALPQCLQRALDAATPTSSALTPSSRVPE